MSSLVIVKPIRTVSGHSQSTGLASVNLIIRIPLALKKFPLPGWICTLFLSCTYGPTLAGLKSSEPMRWVELADTWDSISLDDLLYPKDFFHFTFPGVSFVTFLPGVFW